MDNFRSAQFFIHEDNPFFTILIQQLHFSKNLYNSSLYTLRQAFFKGSTISYEDLEKQMKVKLSNCSDLQGYDYYQMATAQSAQQTIKRASWSFSSFLKSKKKYEKNPKYYTGKPCLPKYLRGKYYIVTLTNQNCKVKGNMVIFPKTYQDFSLDISNLFMNEEYTFDSLREVRFFLKNATIIMEVVYKIKPIKQYKLRKDRICGIDPGVTNFLACSFNFFKHPIIFDGSYLKSVNQYYNKKIAYYTSKAKKYNNVYETKRIRALWEKRHRKIKAYMHKVSHHLIQLCLKSKVSKIVIGHVKGWKKKNKHKQNFAYIPFTMIRKMIEYKANFYGIKVIYVNERYTSGTSFLDGELPQKKYYKKNRRVKRGLVITDKNVAINADVNAGYQMIRQYEMIKNKENRQVGKASISCYKVSTKWKNIASRVERLYIA